MKTKTPYGQYIYSWFFRVRCPLVSRLQRKISFLKQTEIRQVPNGSRRYHTFLAVTTIIISYLLGCAFSKCSYICQLHRCDAINELFKWDLRLHNYYSLGNILKYNDMSVLQFPSLVCREAKKQTATNR